MDGDGGGRWWLLVTVLTWLCWVVFDDGGMWLLWLFVAICFHGRSLFGMVVVGSCCYSPCGWSLLVIVCVDGSGKQKRSYKQPLFVIHHKYITKNKQFHWNSIPVYCREHSSVNSGICWNSTGMKNTRINKLAGPSAKFHSTGMTGFLQE